MREHRRLRGMAMLVVGLSLLCACGEVRGRRILQKANRLYRNAQYPEAVAAFNEAEKFVPDMWQLWLNKGYTCRSMIIPGAKTPENDASVKCALDALKRLQTLKPDDQRGPALYVQTLFDAEQFETLAGIFKDRFQKDAKDLEALNGLIQVYSKWSGHLDEALDWHRKKVETRPDDAEARYSLGVFIWQQLFTRGGGAEMSAFDPRPDPAKPRMRKEAPGNGRDDLVGQQRVDMADEGIKYLEGAVQLRPKYHEAMAYANLLYRQKSFAYFGAPTDWQKCVDKATEWRDKTLLTMGKPVPKPGEVASASAERPEDSTGGATTDESSVKKGKALAKKRGKARGKARGKR